MSYLNGALKYFEYPETLEIVSLASNIDSDPDPDLYRKRLAFPFIMGQSKVKPIIHPAQIKAYSSFIEGLSEADVLIVIGYNFNEDDNHINAIVRDYITSADKDKKLIVVSGENNKIDILRRLRLDRTHPDDIEQAIDIVQYKTETGYRENREIIEECFAKAGEAAND